MVCLATICIPVQEKEEKKGKGFFKWKKNDFTSQENSKSGYSDKAICCCQRQTSMQLLLQGF